MTGALEIERLTPEPDVLRVEWDDGLLEQVSFNNHDRAPFMLPPDEMRAFYDALRAFEQRVNDPRFPWQRVMQAGDAVLFDNWRVLHGRLAYTGLRSGPVVDRPGRPHSDQNEKRSDWAGRVTTRQQALVRSVHGGYGSDPCCGARPCE